MFQTKAYIAKSTNLFLEEGLIPRRNVGPDDILIEVMFVGLNKHDVVNLTKENNIFPMVPGLEVTGVVQNVGTNVLYLTPGDVVGVSRVIDSCKICNMCLNKQFQYCEKGPTLIYNSRNEFNSMELGFPTFGGISQVIVVDKNHVIKIPGNINLARMTPLLYSGMLAYSPIKDYYLKPGDNFGVIGLNEIGNIAIKFGVAIGAQVTVFDFSEENKSYVLYELKADKFIKIDDIDKSIEGSFDFILDTRFEDNGINKIDSFIDILKYDGSLSIINTTQNLISSSVQNKNIGNKTIKKSPISSTKEIQEMIFFCSKYKIDCDIDLISANQINDCLKKLENSSIRNNTVVDVTTIDNENKDINIKEQIDKTINDYISQYQDENTKFTIEDHVELESDSED